MFYDISDWDSLATQCSLAPEYPGHRRLLSEGAGCDRVRSEGHILSFYIFSVLKPKLPYISILPLQK